MQNTSIIEEKPTVFESEVDKGTEWGLTQLDSVMSHLKELESKAIAENDQELLNKIRDSMARARGAEIELKNKFSA